jgi:NDP-hexose C3-ketoreductase / dTDP-4-oxo-2-deoxy-alpha-D-pentos-2-ene 2,3-reductase
VPGHDELRRDDPPGDAHQILNLALEQGINFFDSSNTYGRPRAEGVTEQIIGDWLSAESGRRDRIILATKVYGGKGEWPNDRFLSAVNIRRACEGSLRQLGTDHIDLYQMHHVDRATPWPEIWEAMSVLRAQGKIIYVGSSNFAGWHLAQAQEAAVRAGMLGLVSEQSLYNLAQRTVELEVLPACQSYGLGVLPWSPLHGGLLAGILRKDGAGRSADGIAAENLAGQREQVGRYEAFCDEIGAEPAAVGQSDQPVTPISRASLVISRSARPVLSGQSINQSVGCVPLVPSAPSVPSVGQPVSRLARRTRRWRGSPKITVIWCWNLVPK